MTNTNDPEITIGQPTATHYN
uniref:Uncharacterized protein n=1 Tax=Anguilla anguilla TaxID=7936 RepID=A0A0E9VU03_ANGAN